MIAKVQNGDVIELDTQTGHMTLHVDEAELTAREAKVTDVASHQIGMGREMFAGMRSTLTGAEQGACSLFVGQDD